MDREEAKNILQACRPDNAEDRKDALIADALKFAESDPELMAWFEAEQDFDRQMCDEFDAIYVPNDLKASILSGMRAHHAAAQKSTAESEADISSDATIPFADETTPNETPHSTRKWWAHPGMGIAAALVVMLGLAMIPRSQESIQTADSAGDSFAVAQVPNIIQFLSTQIAALPERDFHKTSNELKPLKTFLANAGAPVPNSTPSPLQSAPTIGCFTFDYQGHKISMICFKHDKVCHLITIDRKNIAEIDFGGQQTFEYEGNAFQVWEDDDKLMIISVEGTASDIPEFI